MQRVSSAVPARSGRGIGTGLVAAAVVGVASALTTVLVSAFLLSILTRFEPRLELGWPLLLGLALGAGIGIFRRGKNSSRAATLSLGLAAALVWLLLNALDPLELGAAGLHWSLVAAFGSMLLAAQLTRYGLRDIDLSNLRRDRLEVILLRLLRGAGFVFFLTIVIFPFYFMVVSSLKPRALYLQDPTLLSVDFGRGLSELLVGYREVLVRFDFAHYILNSTTVALATVVITLTLAILGAYAVTRLRFPGRGVLSRSILLIYMFPAIVLVVPLYSIFTQVGLRDTLYGLLIVYPATTIPVALYMLRSYFQTLPADLEEAGLIDGCTRAGVIWRITLPLSLPAIASVGLYVFMIAWNEFLFAFMFLDSPELFTLPRGMVNLNSQEVPRQFLMAGAVIVTVPVMVLFFWFERYLVGGLTAGGVKG
ncbi:MAG TPA: carbohydrate ABC transporter permease [Trueperaceae bacterium]